MKQITVVDYSIGNVLSVSRAFEYFGAKVNLTRDYREIADASRLVLPGVGAFRVGIEKLKQFNLLDAIVEYAQKQRPLLGICLGMQFLFDYSSEFGRTQGLGLIPGVVEPIMANDTCGVPLKIPHIGWEVLSKVSTQWDTTILSTVNSKDKFYFVHSFCAQPSDPLHNLAQVKYGGNKISAVVGRDNIFGCQFHPEKSRDSGLKLIEQFMKV